MKDEKRETSSSSGVGRGLLPPQPPKLILYHKELRLVKYFLEKKLKKIAKKILTSPKKFDIIYM